MTPDVEKKYNLAVDALVEACAQLHNKNATMAHEAIRNTLWELAGWPLQEHNDIMWSLE